MASSPAVAVRSLGDLLSGPMRARPVRKLALAPQSGKDCRCQRARRRGVGATRRVGGRNDPTSGRARSGSRHAGADRRTRPKHLEADQADPDDRAVRTGRFGRPGRAALCRQDECSARPADHRRGQARRLGRRRRGDGRGQRTRRLHAAAVADRDHGDHAVGAEGAVRSRGADGSVPAVDAGAARHHHHQARRQQLAGVRGARQDRTRANTGTARRGWARSPISPARC